MRGTEDLSTARWCKSTYSNSNGGACLEVAGDFPGAAVAWRKSGHSNINGGDCVEVTDAVPGIVPVRDSKDVARGALVFPAAAWSSFVAGLKGETASGA